MVANLLSWAQRWLKQAESLNANSQRSKEQLASFAYPTITTIFLDSKTQIFGLVYDSPFPTNCQNI